MKVAILTPASTLEIGGTNLNLSFFESMIRQRYDCTRYIPTGIFSLPFKKRFLRHPFRLLPPPLHYPLIQSCLKGLEHFDAIFSCSSHYPLNWLAYYARKSQRNLRYISYLDGLFLPSIYGDLHEQLYMWLMLKLWKKSLEDADLIGVETRFLQALLWQNFRIKSTVVRSVIDPLHFKGNIAGEEMRSKLGLKEETPLILYVDRIEYHKGIHLLIEIFKLVREKIPDAKLILVGRKTSPFYWKRIHRKFDNSIIYFESLPQVDLLECYEACTVFATAATWEEGYSHTIVEAEAHAKPVVAFDIGAHTEVVKHQETGFLIQKENLGKFASCLLTLLKDKKLNHDMGQKARQWASYLVEVGIQEIQEFIKRIEML